MNATPCGVSDQCQNGPEVLDFRARCTMCKFADAEGGPEVHWRPVKPGTKHPKVLQAKSDARFARGQAKLKQLNARDPKKRYYSKVAAAAEKRSNQLLARSGVNITPTRNSGRTFRDADHLVQFKSTVPLEKLTLDTKNQSKVEHPTVHLTELDKVRQDAKHAGSVAGGLLIRNKLGRAVVVFAEEDFKSLFT